MASTAKRAQSRVEAVVLRRFREVLAGRRISQVELAERVELLSPVAGRLLPGGRLLVVTTALTDDSFSRHFDLLLRAQQGEAQLPDIAVLGEQLVLVEGAGGHVGQRATRRHQG